MDILDNDFLVNAEYEIMASKFNNYMNKFYKNRIYSFSNICNKIENKKFENLQKKNSIEITEDYFENDSYESDLDIDSDIDSKSIESINNDNDENSE